jgi:hypothetical protein
LLGSAKSLSLDGEESQAGKGGNLTTLGIYYQGLLNGAIDYMNMGSYWDPKYCSNAAAALLIGILEPKSSADHHPSISQNPVENGEDIDEVTLEKIPTIAPSTIETLDFVTGPMSRRTWALLQARLGNLKSLTVRQSLCRGLKMIWNPILSIPCSFRTSLTRLHLRDCDGIEATDVPGLVEFFSSLTDLTVIACGNEDAPVVQRPRGWSSSDSWTSKWSLTPDVKAVLPNGHHDIQFSQSIRISHGGHTISAPNLSKCRQKKTF